MELSSLPMIELHLHLDGAIPPETMWDLANAQGLPLPAATLNDFRRWLVQTSDCADVNTYLARFELPLQLMQDKVSIARVTHDLLCVLAEQGHIYAWDTFRTKVLTEKVGCLQSFFGKDNAEHGNAMLYNLLALLREAENDRINLARYAYLLARLSPKKNAPDYKLYEQFSHSMMDWALDAVQRHQLITAIYIYVYQNRKGGDTDGRME